MVIAERRRREDVTRCRNRGRKCSTGLDSVVEWSEWSSLGDMTIARSVLLNVAKKVAVETWGWGLMLKNPFEQVGRLSLEKKFDLSKTGRVTRGRDSGDGLSCPVAENDVEFKPAALLAPVDDAALSGCKGGRDFGTALRGCEVGVLPGL